MFKIGLHRIVWFPYRPEGRLIGPLLTVLLLAVGSAGIVKAIDIFTPYNPLQSATSENEMIILLFVLCVVVSIAAARNDYLSVNFAIFPCIVSVTIVAGSTLFLTKPKSDWRSAALQAGVSTVATLGLISRYVQSGGVDLGKLGALIRRTTDRATRILNVPTVSPMFEPSRAELLIDVETLAKDLRQAASEVIHSQRWLETADQFDGFVRRSKMVDHDDFLRDIGEVLMGPLTNLR